MKTSLFGLLMLLILKKEPIEENLILTGDIMLGRSVMNQSIIKNNYNYPFEKVAEKLKSADITAINLENPITDKCPVSNSGFIFCADPKTIEGLNYAGVDVANLANNHMNNYGKNGMIQTENYLKNSNIDFTGDNNLTIKNVKDIKFGFLGFDFTSNNPKDEDFKLISESKNKVDVLVVFVHWGVEYRSTPTDGQKETAKKIIIAGADVVAGSHPHWVQNMEYINGKPVFYSLGNFVFDQPWSEETKKGLAVKLTYQGKELKKIDDMPIYMKKFAQPEWVKND